MAGSAVRNNKKTRIIRRHIQLAIMNDEELSKLLRDVTVVCGVVLELAGSAVRNNKKTRIVLEVAGSAVRNNKKTRIVRRHIQLAIMNDEELSKLLGDVTVVCGVVKSYIHDSLLHKKNGTS
ncbi:Histone-fold [Sesbania bispinosa]|nr:Histone-fold [Sesbania bispinosa]